ncbi:MAG: FecR family protein [Elusimicrobiota bacterium]|nr:FecR family protein [Endomicrobiia bacterium]MDW8165038.1 FecR family protein [Elusimicrobiota bacterium]
MKNIYFILLFLVSFLYSDQNPIAVITRLKGKAVIIRLDKKLEVEKYMPVYVEDKLKTFSSSFVELLFENGISLRVEENCNLDFKKIDFKFSEGKKKTKMMLEIFQGASIVDVEVFKEKYQLDSLHIITPTMVASVRGTVFYINVKDDYSTNVAVFEGEVEGYIDKLDVEELLKLDEEEYEMEELKRKRIVIPERKQTTFSYDVTTPAVIDLTFNMLEYKRTVVDDFLKCTKEYRENFEKFKKQRDEWIRKHKEKFKKEIFEKKKKFMDEFEIEEKEFKNRRKK